MTSPDISAITMPKWGIEMQEGTVTEWHVGEGQRVAKDAPLVDVETDKIVNTVESPTAGLLRRILAPVGEVRAVGALIAVCAEMTVTDAELDAFIGAFRPPETSFEPGTTDLPAAPTAVAPVAPVATDGADAAGEINVSPIARRLAEKLGVDLSRIRGSGPNGRISKEDVEQAAAGLSAAGSAGNPATRTRLSATRLAIARRLLESKQTIPHFRLETSVDTSSIAAQRAALRTTGTAVTVNDYIIRACALSLSEFPALNAHLDGDELVEYANADICVAVSTDSGLMTPIVRNAQAKTLGEISAQVAELATRARAGSLRREDVSDGTFTISNLGMYGLDRFDAIINPPQVAILAVGAARDRVVAIEGSPAIRPVMSLTLSCDHRVVDGALGARFLAALKARLEAAAGL